MKFRLLASAALAAALIPGAHAQEKFTYMSNWYAQAEHGGFYQALVSGLYKKEGIDATIRMGGPQVNGMQLLAAGQIDCFMGYDVSTMKGWENGINAMTVAASFQKDPQVLIGHPGVLNKMEDLPGKTILISTGAQNSY
ncbi:MAG: ABC transporter substrate-binding protein, partial [Betaproteobacteria bacterium]